MSLVLLVLASILLSLLTVTTASDNAATTPTTAAVLGSRDLSPTEFTSVVFTKPTLVKFFAPWCGHCKALAPIWEEAARLIHRTHPNVQLVGVDCTAHGDMCSQFGVHGYPTIKLIRPAETDSALLAAGGGEVVRKVYPYSGQRTVLGFEQFVSQEAQWQAVKAEDYPMPLPASPVPLQLASLDQLKQAEVAAQDSPVASVVHAAAERLKTEVAGEGAGGRFWAAAAAVAGSGSGLWYGEWLNIALGVAVLLIALIAYWLYVSARSSERTSKAV